MYHKIFATNDKYNPYIGNGMYMIYGNNTQTVNVSKVEFMTVNQKNNMVYASSTEGLPSPDKVYMTNGNTSKVMVGVDFKINPSGSVCVLTSAFEITLLNYMN
jgi:plastocyanin domain-containing protein